MGLRGEIGLNGRFSRFRPRPIFETQPDLLRLKVVPTPFQPQLAGDCGVWRGIEFIAPIFQWIAKEFSYLSAFSTKRWLLIV
ncbi:hypothetical protein DB330_01905 [Lacticaseibacillus casei]|nr:hypothetical protein [Lacticaseibacillus casei]PTU98532.1 hypothetical protein DB330_01905 [Lacticaseibacillus casei]PTU99815.1 hypothetical protein DB326_01760 [Lacticaseibacillus casei]RXS58452.1 hypothetical protein ETB94_01840 [Lacticaseibacillus casei]TLF36182.1 hypothetical protein FEI10_02275 [Lacticaseibacillus casei]